MSDGAHIFISYPHTEADFTARLAADLKNSGVRVWMDILEGGIRGGDDWRRAIEQGVDTSAAIIPIICPDYVGSTYCRKELARAERLNRKIFPVFLRELPKPSDWPIEVEGIQYTDFRAWLDERIYREQLQDLLTVLKRDAAAQVGPPPDAETQYLTRLIAELEARKGVLEYVDLAGQMDEPLRPRPRIADDWGLEGAFALLETSAALPANPAISESLEPQSVPLNDIRQAVEKHSRFVLIGEPGAGKTTTLRRLALDAARARLADSGAPLPLLLYLPAWGDEPTAGDFLTAQIEKIGLGSLAKNQLLLYLDGLNEMGGSGAKKAKLLREWLAGADVPARIIITCRAADYANELVVNLPTVLAGEMDEGRIRQFAHNYLGEDDAGRFLERVTPTKFSGHTDESRSLFRLAKNPYLLTALMVVYKSSPEGDLPRNNGALFRRLAMALWERERTRNLLGWIPFEQMESSLGRLAFAMINEDKPIDVPLDYVRQYVEDVGLLPAAASANFVEIRGNELRFYHQLMLEYFAATSLHHQNIGSVLLWPRLIGGGRLARKWDQAVIAACGISVNTSEMIKVIQQGDPFLAALCVSSGIHMDRDSIEDLVAHLMWMVSNPREWRDQDVFEGIHNIALWVIRENAIMALGNIGHENAIPTLIQALSDEDTDVRRHTLEALIKVGIPSVPSLITKLKDLKRPSYSSIRVCDYAADALQKIGTPEALEAVRKWREEQNQQ